MANTTMTTVVGVFKDYKTAQTVADELEGSGFSRGNIHVSSGSEGTYDTSSKGSQETHGGISGFFKNLFGSDDTETGYYEEAVRGGRAVVTVDVDESQADYAADIMNRNGAINVDENASSSGSSKAETLRSDTGERSIPVVKEELQVGKRAVQRGGVRVYSRVVDRPVEEKVTLREEHVRVQRRPADRAVSAADAANLRDQTIEVTETAEEPVVSKRARVVEEVSVGKETTERTETIRDSVRSTEVNVEQLGQTGSGRTTSSYENDFRQDFESRYASSGGRYESYAPAYQYGYSAASDPRWKGQSWSDIESNLKTDYLRNNPNSTWDNVKGAVRYGWETVTGKRSSAR